MKRTCMTIINKAALVIFLSILFAKGYAQEEYKDPKNRSFVETFEGGLFHEVVKYPNIKFKKHPKNIILLIGDGMGISQVFAGMTANKGQLNLENFKHCGYSRTQSADNYVTDSAAGGTALACGVKTNNGAVGVDERGVPVENIRERAASKGMKTGVVTSALVNHATPAVFLAHRANRNMYEEIALDIVNSNVDVAIGGGRTHFENRKDGLNLSDSLAHKGVKVTYNIDQFEAVNQGRVVGLFANMHVEHYPERGHMLPRATAHAINLLKEDKDGFFLMVEASKIDAGGHQNKTPFITKEMLDFDQVIGAALEFAAKEKNTLVIVTADHETGGMCNTDGNFETGEVKAQYVYGKHTGDPVPVFAFGPKAEWFTGFMENTDIAEMLKALINKNY
ncbi:alkaline phosphatase [Puteibacter caeruleilacunae]|nr:alkaline phosphatase [Puteibacter caeruleilacunae]